MKIAFFAKKGQILKYDKSGLDSGRKPYLKVDYFSLEEGLFLELERNSYDMVVIYPKERMISWKEIMKQIKTKEYESASKYIAPFNGQNHILDICDIQFFESYYRKTSVVLEEGRIRVRTRLDEEERRLPKEQFIRINRHNIINMSYIRSVKREEIQMQNGECLYINEGRKKKFERRYREFLESNYMLT